MYESEYSLHHSAVLNFNSCVSQLNCAACDHLHVALCIVDAQ